MGLFWIKIASNVCLLPAFIDLLVYPCRATCYDFVRHKMIVRDVTRDGSCCQPVISRTWLVLEYLIKGMVKIPSSFLDLSYNKLEC